MNHALLALLLDFGLTKHEAQVYLASLSLGPSTILKISNASQVKRTTIYTVIEALKQKGLIRIEQRGLKRLFVPLSPEQLNAIFEEKREKFRDALPDLLALYQYEEHNEFIEYYEGIQSMKSLYDSILASMKKNDDYLVVSNVKRFVSLDTYFQRFIERRSRLPIHVRLLLEDTDVARAYQRQQKKYRFHVRLLPKEIFLGAALAITPKKMVIHQISTPTIAMLIQNKSIIDMQRQMFEIMWKAVE